jgi:hypothetical protein
VIVRFAPEARDAIREKRAWWESHRDKAPRLFAEELRAAVETLRVSPTVGAQKYTRAGGRIVWRLLMPKTRHHIYYFIDEAAGEVAVITVWNAQGEAGPDIP